MTRAGLCRTRGEDAGAGADVDDDVAGRDRRLQRVAEALRARAIVEHLEMNVGAHPAVRGIFTAAGGGVDQAAAIDEIVDARRDLGRVLGPRRGDRREDLLHRARHRERIEHGQRHAGGEVTLTVDLDDDLVLVREAHEDVLCSHQHRVGACPCGHRSVDLGHPREDSIGHGRRDGARARDYRVSEIPPWTPSEMEVCVGAGEPVIASVLP